MKFIKSILRAVLPDRLFQARSILQRTKPLAKRDCPVCGYSGFFGDYGRPPRIDAQCPECGSLERHRLFWLWYQVSGKELQTPVLHFAAEKILESKFRELYTGGGYVTADLFQPADMRINIEKIDLPDESQKTVICNHVLEHVDDRVALREIFRILSPDGILIASVPIIEGWSQTYEDKSVITPELRELHFGQNDHVRFYGRDFRERLTESGFTFSEVTAEGENVMKYGLWRGEKFFVCKKII